MEGTVAVEWRMVSSLHTLCKCTYLIFKLLCARTYSVCDGIIKACSHYRPNQSSHQWTEVQ